MVERITRHMGYTDFKGVVAINDENEVIGSTMVIVLWKDDYNQLMRKSLNSDK